MKLPYYFDFDGLFLPMILHPGPHTEGKETDSVQLSESSGQQHRLLDLTTCGFQGQLSGANTSLFMQL